MQQHAGFRIAVQQGVGAMDNQPACRTAPKLPAIGGNAVDDEARLAAPKNYAVASRKSRVAINLQRYGAKQMGTAIVHQGLMLCRFNQPGDSALPLSRRKAQHVIAALCVPQLAQSLSIAAIGQWSILRDQIAQGLSIFEQAHAGREAF